MTSSKTKAAIAEAARRVVKAVAAALKVVLPETAPPTLYRLGDKTGHLYVVAEYLLDGMVADDNAIFRWDSVPMGVRQERLVADALLDGKPTMFEFSNGDWRKRELKKPLPIDAVAKRDYSQPVVSVVEGKSPTSKIESALHLTLADGRVIAADSDYLSPLLKDTRGLTISATENGQVIRVLRNDTPIAYVGATPVPVAGE